MGDMDLKFAQKKISGHERGEAFQFDASDDIQRRKEIAEADLVISMLPATLHLEVVKDAISAGRNVITPSYVADEMWPLDNEAKQKGVLILNEMGVDPGIDHMSAMDIIHSIEKKGGELQSFESFTGGLIAPESDNNPWNYKVTWNPRNVVLAGAGGTARFLHNGKLKFIPYHKLFEHTTEIEVPGYGKFDGYANRDSLKYRSIYGLENIPTLYRGTLRKSGFCRAWNFLVQLGLTDDSFTIENSENKTWAELSSAFLPNSTGNNVESTFKKYLRPDDQSLEKIKWLGIFDEKKLGLADATPATALQKLIEEKWKLDEGDKDMIVMWHRFVYLYEGKKHEQQSSLVVLGEDVVHTAMANTVGLPIAVAAKMMLRGEMKLTGITLPTLPEIYNPVLGELKQMGISFSEQHRVLN